MDYNQNYNYGYSYTNELYQKEESEKKGIKQIGKVAGLCIIAYVALENFLPLPIALSRNLSALYKESDEFFYLVACFLSVISVFCVFLIGGLYLKKQTRTEFLLLENPKDIRLAVYSIGPGLLTCLIGNQITAFFLTYMKIIGFELTTPEMNTPSSATGRILFVIAIALIPPLTEESAIRGSILQPLRRYGDGFAIVACAIIFAVLHGNLVQAPFAFIAGIGLGYICCVTDSLLPAFAVHFLNNLYSVATDFMVNDIKDEKILERNYEILTVALTVICVILTVLFVFRLNGRRLHKKVTVLGTAGKFKALIFNPPMIIAIIIMIVITAQFVNRV